MFNTLYKLKVVFCIFSLSLLSACSNTAPVCSPNFITQWQAHQQITDDITYLTSPKLQGRKTATKGASLTQGFLIKRFTELGLTPWQQEFAVPFEHDITFSTISGVNIVATIPAKIPSKRWRIVTAHYDHLGKQGRKIFHGADDNASGVAGMIALAQQWRDNPPLADVNLMLVATDAEEPGLYGSYALVEQLKAHPDMKVELSVNLDMIGHPDHRNALYVEGEQNIANFHDLLPLITANTQLCIRTHQRNLLGARTQKIDWLRASDHYPFHKAGYSWIYFGVPTHNKYHTPEDTLDTLNIDFIVAVVESVFKLIGHNELILKKKAK